MERSEPLAAPGLLVSTLDPWAMPPHVILVLVVHLSTGASVIATCVLIVHQVHLLHMLALWKLHRWALAKDAFQFLGVTG